MTPSPPRVAEVARLSAPAPELLLAVAEIGRELAGGAELDQQLRLLLHVLDRRLGAARSVLYLVDGEDRALTVEATHGLAAQQLRPRFGSGVAGRVARSGQPVVVPVVRHDPMALSELADLSAWHDNGWNLIAVPIRRAERCVAVLATYYRYRDADSTAERCGVLDVAASLLGKALRGGDRAPVPAFSDDTLARAGDPPFEYANLIGTSAVMRQLYEQIGQVARTNATTLLRGESGTGKEVVAHAIHHNSPRSAMPFVKVNCAALPEPLFESELFGHERGAFTGAHSRKKGRFELARGGTLFLDEIGELSLTTQAKLLRVLQFREFERLGGTETLHTDVRIIAATNKNLERAIEDGSFREDLYYRIDIFSIVLPPLRERRADIPALADYFLSKFAAEHGQKITRLSSGALELLARYSWPGNVRELENVIERAVVVCRGPVLQDRHLPRAVREAADDPPQLTLIEAVQRLERQMIEDALRTAAGNVTAAARALGATERVVRYKVRKLGIGSPRPRR
ncbi:MAG TPA: sigma 54-interacting transcriptional regulator [Kofleriaceae bacterium]|nr:sigma 54-interacting transcriptional regulator [Kofleriaceae bacterium]